MAAPSRPRRPSGLHASRRAAFTMAEILVVMAIITILAGALAIVLPKLRTMAMRRGAEADIQMIAQALTQYHDDIGHYPTAPYVSNAGPFADGVLLRALTYHNAGGNNCGWAAANDKWGFIRSDNIGKYSSGSSHNSACENDSIWVGCPGGHQVLDPWGAPYYYIAHPDYIRGVCIHDDSDETFKQGNKANLYGTTERPNDFRSSSEHEYPPDDYKGPPPKMSAFYNPLTFQLISKGPDGLTDVEDGEPEVIDACDRGTDSDDVNNFGK